jgi:hypothetical protein
VEEAAQEGVELAGLRASPPSELLGSRFRYVFSLHENRWGRLPQLPDAPTPMNWSLEDTGTRGSGPGGGSIKNAIDQLRRRLAYFVAIAAKDES